MKAPGSQVRRFRPLALVALQCVIATVLGSVAAADPGATVSDTAAGSNLVVWRGAGVQGAFVAPDGSVEPSFQISPTFPHDTSVGTDGTNHLVVWAQSRSVGCDFDPTEIYGAIVNKADKTVSQPFPIRTFDGSCPLIGNPGDFWEPRVGFDGTNYFVVWNTTRTPDHSLEGARVSPEGVVLDEGGVPLALQPAFVKQARRPRLAFDGTNFLVVWYAADDLCLRCTYMIQATRVNTKATPVALDPQTIPIGRVIGFNPAGVAFDGTNWVVVWNRDGDGLLAARVSGAGIVLDPLGVKIGSYDHDNDGPAVVAQGGNVLVSWGRETSSIARALIVRSTTTSSFEVVMPEFQVRVGNPEGALTATDFLLVSRQYDYSTSSYEVLGMRITSGGEVLDPEPFRISTPDTTPPETTIDSAPPATTNSDSATFEFNSSQGGSTFECRLDGGLFSVCSSPKTYSELSEGTHTFEVAATDSAGNTDASPASWSWTVDVTAPDTTITEGPPASTNNASASFSFSSSESGSSFECQLDGSGFAACSSPSNYAGLAEGEHLFEVRSTDPAGNLDSTAASWSWTVDTSSPGVPKLSSPLDGSSTDNTKPTFDWSDVADSSGVTYQIQVDNSGSEFASPEIDQSSLAPSSFTPSTALAAGTYSWRARAVDGAGNAGAWSAVFAVTITAPQGGIAGNVTNQATKKSIAGATVNCGSGGTAFTASDGTYSITGVAPGSYSCTASASGYKSSTKTVTVKANQTTTANFALRKG